MLEKFLATCLVTEHHDTNATLKINTFFPALYNCRLKISTLHTIEVFLNRQATARYRALAPIILGRERFSCNLSF